MRIMRLLLPCLLLFIVGAGNFIADSTDGGEDDALDPDFALVKISTDLVQNRHPGSLAGYFVVTLGRPDFDRFADDSDMGPFTRAASGAQGDSLALILPPNPDEAATHCVFFKGTDPVSYIAVQLSKVTGTVDEAILRALVPLDTGDAAEEGREELFFQDVTLTADDDSPEKARRILSAGPR